MVRIYTKKKGCPPDFKDPIILANSRGGITIKEAIMGIHRGLIEEFQSAYIWGRSCKFSPMTCGLGHTLCDEDVLQIIKKSAKTGETISNQPKIVQKQEAKKDKDKKAANKKK